MSDILVRICADKRAYVEKCREQKPIEQLEALLASAPPVRPFADALNLKAQDVMGVIAEMKRGSPSGGEIRADFNPATIAKEYEAGGAACLSILTDTPYFMGQDADLVAARAACVLPVLRKDFMVDPYQIIESRTLGADCILIILAALAQDEAIALSTQARALGMDVLVEVHDEEEMARAHDLPATLIGINNRNLKTLATDIATTTRLLPLAPATLPIVSESGLKTAADLSTLANAGIRRFLIGESILRRANLQKAVTELVQAP